MHVGRQVSDALEQSIDKAQKDKKIKFDQRDKKIYFTIAFVVTVYFAICWIVTFTTESISLPDFILICAMTAIYPLMVLVPALWIRFLDVCIYLRRLERYGYEVPEDSRNYDKLLENLPRKESVVEKRKINDGIINTSISAVITVGILCYCIWYRQKYQWEPFYFFNYIGLSIWCIVTLRYALQISDKKYKADLELDDTRKTRESVMEALMGMLLLMVFSLVAIACIIVFTKVAMKAVVIG